jgi:hypothetical protein
MATGCEPASGRLANARGRSSDDRDATRLWIGSHAASSLVYDDWL